MQCIIIAHGGSRYWHSALFSSTHHFPCYTLQNVSPLELEFQVEYQTYSLLPNFVESEFKLEFQVELLIRRESVAQMDDQLAIGKLMIVPRLILFDPSISA